MSPDTRVPPERIAEKLRGVFSNEVIRAIGSLSQQQQVCREQNGVVAFVTGMEAAREYAVEQCRDLLTALEAAQADDAKLRDAAERQVSELREQAQLYIDQREMTLAAKREADAEVARLRAQLDSLFSQNR